MYICSVRKTKEDTAKTIDDLLDSAISLFIKDGYTAVTLEQIAAKIGMTRGAFYHHFKSKEDLLNAVIRRERNSFENKLQDLFKEKKEPEVHLKKILDHIIENFFENKRFNRFIHFTWFKIESSMIEHKFFYQGATNELLVTEIAAIIKRGQKKGVFKKGIPALVLALQVISSILGMYRLYFQSKKYMTKGNAKAMEKQFIKMISIK
ncbi:MAG: transcriptional regulator, TetR family [Bacteroidetes bacterium]|nr:transcriptional regulator, TetR family [Bacteroidota bacterium]